MCKCHIFSIISASLAQSVIVNIFIIHPNSVNVTVSVCARCYKFVMDFLFLDQSIAAGGLKYKHNALHGHEMRAYGLHFYLYFLFIKCMAFVLCVKSMDDEGVTPLLLIEG